MRANRIDDNQDAVVKALEKCGCLVQRLNAVKAGCPDLLVGRAGKLFLMEIKPGTAKDKRQRELNELETKWHARWRGFPVHVVLCPEDALRAVGFSDVRARVTHNAQLVERKAEAVLAAFHATEAG
jgi:Holliday junction resolvase